MCVYVYLYIHHMFEEEKRCVKYRGLVLLKVILLLKTEKEKVTKRSGGTGVKWQVLPTCL